MRFTVIDHSGAVSFVGPCAALAGMISGCIGGASTLEQLLNEVGRTGVQIVDLVTSGLAVFDEHNAYGNFVGIHSAIDHLVSHEIPPFRIVDDRTRQASLQPVRAGALIFNLRERRIVQIQNTYADVQQMGLPARRLMRAGWRILP